MRKGLWILLIITGYFLSGCSSTRKIGGVTSDKPTGPTIALLYGDVADNNVANQGVFIRRIKLEASIEGNRNRFTANLRKTVSGEWLVSVRSLLGIEVARIYANGNEVILLDRLAGTADIYSWERLTREFGISYDMLPLLVGDIPWKKELERKVIECDSLIRIAGRTGPDWRINIDCEVGKPEEIKVSDYVYNHHVTFLVHKFLEREGRFLPYEMNISEETGILQIKYTMEDIDVNWSGDITFSIPSNYKINR